MKGYLWLLLVTATLLMVLPIPAYSAATATAPTPTSPTDRPVDTVPTPPPTTEDAATEPTFRILCGEEIVTLTESEFLLCNLAMEMSPTAHEEALKAQTVATYTYYARRRQAQAAKPDPALKGADFATPNTSFPAAYTAEMLRERWGDRYDEYHAKLSAAVAAVTGVTLTYEGQLIDACYHAISSGSTEDAATVWGTDLPYLQAVASPGDRLASGFASEATFTAAELREMLTAAYPDLALGDDPAAWFGTPTLSDGGTVADQPVGDSHLAGTQVRHLLGLRSAAYTVTYADGTFTFSVRGYGHGVGMSQHGADYLARQGYRYDEILRYYYTDVEINFPE